VAPPSKKALPPIIGHPMANFIAYPVANLSTVSSSQLQLMKMYTRESEIRSPVNFWSYFHPARFAGLFCALCRLCKIANFANFANFAIPANLSSILKGSYAIQSNTRNKTS